MKRILLLCFMGVFALFSVANAQERTVSGKVTSSEDGSGLPGVNVIIKGTASGSTTDIDGNFKITVPEGATLQFSAIGFTAQEVEVGARSVIDITLETDVKQLSEVVVTAGGIAREKKALGYSVQDVKGDDLTKARESNLVNTLTGRVAGVQVTGASGGVGSSSRIVLRGASSLTGNNQPLFVVDGIPINNDNFGSADGFGGADKPNGAAEINPDDIASISVLKGPNAAALYGSRASNGVIVITTKSGRGTKGIGVSVNSSAQFDTPLRLPDYQNAYGGGYDPTYYKYIDGTSGSGGEDESWGPALDRGLEFVQWNDFDGQPSPWVSRPDNVRNFFETGKNFQNNVSISGGSDKAFFRLSLSNLDQKGMIPNTELKRNTVTLNSGLDVTEKFKAETSISYIKSNSDNLPGGGYDNNNPMQQFTWFQRNVDIAALKDYENLPLASDATSAGGTPANWNTNFNNNPYWVLHNNTQGFTKDRIMGNVRLSYAFTDYLTLAARTGTDYFTDLSTAKRAVGSNDFPNGNYVETDRTWQETNSDLLLTFNKDIASDLTLNASLGANHMRQVYSRNTLEAPELEIPGVYNLANSKVALQAETFDQQKEIHSVYGSMNLGFRNYLFLDVVARNDWSSTLPIDNNSYFYYSGSLSADITSIIGLDSDILNYAKVRGSYAQVGSDTGPYNLQNVYAFFDPWGGSLISPTVANTLNNPALKPEQTSSIEFGGEFKFWKNRIGLDLSYYQKTTSDQIMPVNVSGASGFTSFYANAGEMVNKGIEFSLTATPIDMANGLKWDVTVNYNRNRNEVVSLAPGLPSLTIGTYWNASIVARPGEPYGTIFGPDFQRDPNGNIIHEGGVPLKDNTNKVLGNVNPDWIGGLNNNISFKGISLGVLIDAKMGGDIYSMTNAWGRYAGVLEETLLGRENGIVGNGVMVVGTNGDGSPIYGENNVVVTAQRYNHAAFGNSVVAGSVFDASYIKLRQITLGYALPKSLIGNTPFRNVTVSIVGRNLALLYSKAPHIDPETAFGNGNLQGIEHAQLPTARSVGFNLSFNL